MKNFGVITLFLLFAFAANANNRVIYFGIFEVQSGALKSADGNLPHVGEKVTLRVNLLAFSGLMCGYNNTYCVGLNPELYIRFHGNDQFSKVQGLPRGGVRSRGPAIDFEDHDVNLNLPSDADRIEVYMKWELHSWDAYGCHLEYDTTVCDISINPNPYSVTYLSNYGRNFKIGVVQ